MYSKLYYYFHFHNLFYTFFQLYICIINIKYLLFVINYNTRVLTDFCTASNKYIISLDKPNYLNISVTYQFTFKELSVVSMVAAVGNYIRYTT